MRLTFCVLCGQNDPNTLEHHHYIPKVWGGTDDETNMFTVCGTCHGKIHDIPRPLSLGPLIKLGNEIAGIKSLEEQKVIAEENLQEAIRKIEEKETKVPAKVQRFTEGIVFKEVLKEKEIQPQINIPKKKILPYIEVKYQPPSLPNKKIKFQYLPPLPGETMPKIRQPKSQDKIKVIPDDKYPNMWRVKLPNGTLSDLLKRTRAMDLARSIYGKIEND